MEMNFRRLAMLTEGCYRVARRHMSRWTYRVLHRLRLLTILGHSSISQFEIVWLRRNEEQVDLSLPASNDDLPRDITSKVGQHRLGPDHIVFARDVHLVGTGAVPIDPNGNLLAFALNSDNYRNPFIHIGVRPMIAGVLTQKRNAADDVEVACSLVNAWCRSYFHWMLELLPRVLTLRESSRAMSAKIIIQRDPTDWQVRSLELLGVSESQVVTPARSIFARTLAIPSFPRKTVPGRTFSLISPRRLREVRQLLNGNANAESTSQPTRRIVISRSKANGRAVVNENEVITALKPYGFELHVLEGMSLDDQIRLFGNAQVVLAPHGAGLTNILFCPPQTTVVELYGDYYNTSFYTLAQCLGLNYSLFKCGACQSRATNSKRSNLKVDVAQLIKFCARNSAL